MKRIVTYKVFESAGSGLTKKQEVFLNKYTKGSWTYNPTTGLVDVEGDFDCEKRNLKTLSGVKFGKVSGYFDCSINDLTSLEGAPQEVDRWFSCNYNKLTSLKGAPQKVGEGFSCSDNNLTSLEGAPQKVGGCFYCNKSKLTSLKGAPKKVGGDFSCTGNELTSLEGAPQEVGGDFLCYSNPLTSLIGAPRRLSRGFYSDAFQLGTREWNLKGFLEILKVADGTPKAQSLVLTLISPDVLNQEIRKDPSGMIKKLKRVWNDPAFQDIQRQLQFPAEYGDVDKLIRSMNRMDDIKDFI